MFIALVIATALLALITLNSSAAKLRKSTQVLDVIHGTVGVPLAAIPVLAALEIAGALGIIAGLWLAPLGVVAAAGLTLYFVSAAIGHLRAGDMKGIAMPLIPLALSIVVLVLRVITL